MLTEAGAERLLHYNGNSLISSWPIEGFGKQPTCAPSPCESLPRCAVFCGERALGWWIAETVPLGVAEALARMLGASLVRLDRKALPPPRPWCPEHGFLDWEDDVNYELIYGSGGGYEARCAIPTPTGPGGECSLIVTRGLEGYVTFGEPIIWRAVSSRTVRFVSPVLQEVPGAPGHYREVFDLSDGG